MTPDTVFRIASMTKALATVAAMQLVEQGKLTLDDPVPNIDPTLGSPTVLEGFDAAGAPKVRPAKGPITLRRLLTHTAGFSYDICTDVAKLGRATLGQEEPGGALAAVTRFNTLTPSRDSASRTRRRSRWSSGSSSRAPRAARWPTTRARSSGSRWAPKWTRHGTSTPRGRRSPPGSSTPCCGTGAAWGS